MAHTIIHTNIQWYIKWHKKWQEQTYSLHCCDKFSSCREGWLLSCRIGVPNYWIAFSGNENETCIQGLGVGLGYVAWGETEVAEELEEDQERQKMKNGCSRIKSGGRAVEVTCTGSTCERFPHPSAGMGWEEKTEAGKAAWRGAGVAEDIDWWSRSMRTCSKRILERCSDLHQKLATGCTREITAPIGWDGLWREDRSRKGGLKKS